LIAFIIFAISINSYASVPTVKVKIADSKDDITLSGKNIVNHLDLNQSTKKYYGHQKLKFNCKKFSSAISLRKNKSIKLASVSAGPNLIKWNEGVYKGKMNVILSDDGKSCDLVNEVSIESYISTLLAKEMHNSWPVEALKAQAIAARTYALHKIKTDEVSKTKGFNVYYDLESSQKHQVSGSLKDSSTRTYYATRLTEGLVLVSKKKKLEPAFYHSKCGGHTLRPDQVWNHKVSGYTGVKCPYCHKHGNKDWKVKVKPAQLISLVDKTLQDFHSASLVASKKKLRMTKDRNKNATLRIYDGDNLKTVQKSRLRVKLGYKKALSNNFKIAKIKNDVYMMGKGMGHGVGMCQYGALEMAKLGKTYKQILKHYFPNFKIRRLY
jgi:stage II sporulation protein D